MAIDVWITASMQSHTQQSRVGLRLALREVNRAHSAASYFALNDVSSHTSARSQRHRFSLERLSGASGEIFERSRRLIKKRFYFAAQFNIVSASFCDEDFARGKDNTTGIGLVEAYNLQ
jgi:hypothetical protein